MADQFRPLIVGLGGAARAGSSSEQALDYALKAAEAKGARTRMLGGAFLASLPLYGPEGSDRTPEEMELVATIREADGVIISTPAYHGGVSGLVKNALDYTEDMRADERPYLEGRSVGCIVSAAGWQGTTTTLVALRSIVHALRGWPTPLGVCINSTEPAFDIDGRCLSDTLSQQLALVAVQTVKLAGALRSTPAS